MTKRPDFRAASASGRDLAVEIVYICDQDGAFAHAAWSRALSGRNLDMRERRLGMELAFGSIRRKKTLDWCIAKAAGRSVHDIDPLALSLLRIGAYQLLFMSRIPAHAAVSESVESTRRLGHPKIAGFINAALRRIASPRFDPGFPGMAADPVKSLAVTLSYPEWLVESWIGQFGLEATERMLNAGNEPPAVMLRANTRRVSRDELAERLGGVATEPGRYAPEALRIVGPIESVESLPGFAEGLFSVQDESSMLVAHVLGHPRVVIDACAAPGGKAMHIAELARDEARVVACDISALRVALVRESALRLGLRSVEAIECDARELPTEWAGKADAVLVDAPCTGLGVLARRADARWRKGPRDIAKLAPVQAEILAAAAACVAPGGALVYSTCTVGRAENSDQAEAFLHSHPDFRPSPLAPHMPSDAARALCDGDSHMLQLLPGISGTDGFFIARFVRPSAMAQ